MSLYTVITTIELSWLPKNNWTELSASPVYSDGWSERRTKTRFISKDSKNKSNLWNSITAYAARVCKILMNFVQQEHKHFYTFSPTGTFVTRRVIIMLHDKDHKNENLQWTAREKKNYKISKWCIREKLFYKIYAMSPSCRIVNEYNGKKKVYLQTGGPAPVWADGKQSWQSWPH